MLVIVGASGKLGFATLTSLLDSKLIDPSQITCTTSSSSGAAKLDAARKLGVTIKQADWDDEQSHWTKVLEDCDKLFLISSARIERDFGDALPGKGREADHFNVLAAAREAGVKHVYYTSLAFANPSLSRVMKAHERTEDWLTKTASPMKYTIIREGLYNESWPLYLGHYDVDGLKREEVKLGGDSKLSWTSIPDLGLANALILAAPSDEWTGRTVYLSQSKAHSLADVARMVSKAKGHEVKIQMVTRQEHEDFYVDQLSMDLGMVKWWSKTYDALSVGECEIHDPTLEQLLATKGATPTSMGETVAKMLQSSS